MNATNTIDYFNQVSCEIFEVLSDIKYSIRLLEIIQSKRFIGFSIDTEYFTAQITVLTPDNPKYMRNRSCSMQLYSFDDSEFEKVLHEFVSLSIEECVLYLIDEDIFNSIQHPKYNLN